MYALSSRPTASQSIEAISALSATPSSTATPSVQGARRGAAKRAGGVRHLAPRLAGVFRARRDDGSGAGGLRRRQAEKCRQIGWYTARLLRLSQLAYLLSVKQHAWVRVQLYE